MENLVEVRTNVHQWHLDSVVLAGKEGLDEIKNYVKLFKKSLQDDTDTGLNITQKIDGAPAVLICHGLKGYPDTCVGIKSFLNKPENALSSNEEIKSKYGDRPDMAEMLKYSLQLAKSIPNGEAWQGDCLFTNNTLREREIKGKNYITFQPNKIIYAFDENSDSYDKIINSVFGICLHTRYTQSGDGWSQSFRINPESLNAPDNFYIMSPTLNYPKQMSEYDFKKIDSLYSRLEVVTNKLTSNEDYENLINNKEFMKYWQPFENSITSDRQSNTIDHKTFFKDLIQFVRMKSDKELATKLQKVKDKEKATEKSKAALDELLEIINNNKGLIIQIAEAFNITAEIKMIILEGFNKSQQDYKTFLRRKSTGEYTDSDGEGISISDAQGNIVKLVDRAHFSSANRDPDIESGFEHNESLEEEFDELTSFGEVDD